MQGNWVVKISWRLPRIEIAGDICLSRGQGPPRAVEPMMKMMIRRRRRNERRKVKARVVASKITLNSLMKIYETSGLQRHQISLELISEFKSYSTPRNIHRHYSAENHNKHSNQFTCRFGAGLSEECFQVTTCKQFQNNEMWVLFKADPNEVHNIRVVELAHN